MRSFSASGSSWKWGGAILAGIVVAGSVCALTLGVLLWIKSKRGVFLTTTSPQNTFSVSLKGGKGRPLIIPNEVKADVFKLGQPYVSDIWLHSTEDSFDLSFEKGFPNVRWVAESTLEFYQPQYFEKGTDSLVVANRAAGPIKYLHVQSENKFLLFELKPGSSVSLVIPAPRGDLQLIALQGSFLDGKEIPFNSKDFNRRSTQQKHSRYEITIDESSSIIQAKD